MERVKALKKKLLPGYLGEKIAEDDYHVMNADYVRQIAGMEGQLLDLAESQRAGSPLLALLSFS